MWINFLNPHFIGFHSPHFLAENVPTCFHEKTLETMKKPKKPHWHPQLSTTQPTNFHMLIKSKTLPRFCILSKTPP
jgi:hypothetical protein